MEPGGGGGTASVDCGGGGGGGGGGGTSYFDCCPAVLILKALTDTVLHTHCEESSLLVVLEAMNVITVLCSSAAFAPLRNACPPPPPAPAAARGAAGGGKSKRGFKAGSNGSGRAAAVSRGDPAGSSSHSAGSGSDLAQQQYQGVHPGGSPDHQASERRGSSNSSRTRRAVPGGLADVLLCHAPLADRCRYFSLSLAFSLFALN